MSTLQNQAQESPAIRVPKFMSHILENIFSRLWNWTVTRRPKAVSSGLLLGFLIRDDQPTKYKVLLSQGQRTSHALALGRTGTGKSSLIDSLIEQDIKAGRGFLAIKFHDDHKRILAAIAAEEKHTCKDLCGRTIIIDPSDLVHSVGLNPLEIKAGLSTFIQIADISNTIRSHPHLENF